jgi:hypothetical protein
MILGHCTTGVDITMDYVLNSLFWLIDLIRARIMWLYNDVNLLGFRGGGVV